MSSSEVISRELEDSILSCLGERFDHGSLKLVRMETPKGDKQETKVLGLSKYRAFILTNKMPTKLEHEFNFLDIHRLESLKPLQLKIHVNNKKDSLGKTVYSLSTTKTEEVDVIIETIALDIKKCFPNVFPIDAIIPRLIVKPESRMMSLNMKLEESYPDPGPCGGFTQMYTCMCDLHQESYMAEVAWDVDTIYLSQDTKELCLNDFDHLSNRDLVPIISALIHNNWFTKLSFRNASKLSSDASREINKVLQKSSYLEQLILENVGLKGSFMQDMCTAVLDNNNTSLRHINVSHNPLDDKGIRYLSSLLHKLPNGLLELNLAHTGLTAEGTLYLGKALVDNNFMSTSLVKFDVSGNAFRDGDISNLTMFLAQPNSLTHLNMADTECALDNVFVALFRGCCSNLSHINLAGNTFTYRKGKDVPIQVSFRQFFATSIKLKYLNLSRNKLPHEVVKEVLLGIGSNDNLQDVELDLSSNELKMEGCQVIAGGIAHVNNITSLNLSDNDFNLELAHLVDWIGQNKSLLSLDLSKNMGGVKYKQLLKVLDTIVQVIQTDELPLQTLSLADNKMKFETIQIINALGSNTTLTSVDISGNSMGDIGARMLAKALQLNTKLQTVKLDGNGITASGFNDLANALEKNYTLKYMPTPVNDVMAALKANPEKTSSSLQKIQTLLQRNHSQHKFSDEQAFRLQQGFLYTTAHQMVNKLVVQIQETIRGLSECTDEDIQADVNKAQDFILDADNSKLLLAALHQVALTSDNNDVKNKLDEMAEQLRRIVENQLKGSASGMLKTSSEQCTHVMQDSALKESLNNVCHGQSTMPQRFLLDVVEQVGAAISNKMGEAHLAMASHISDTIIDEIMEHLTDIYHKLLEHQVTLRIRRGSLLTNGTEAETNEQGNKDTEEKKEVAGKQDEDKDSDSFQQRRIGKVRPRSVIMRDFELTVAEVDSADSADKLDITDGGSSSKPVAPSSKMTSPTPKLYKQNKKVTSQTVQAFDEVSKSQTGTLTDLRKNRPRAPRQRPSRPVNKPTTVAEGVSAAEPVDSGVSDFFSAGLTDLVVANNKSPSSTTQNSVDLSPDASKVKKSKKMGGLFHKKGKDEDKSKKEDKKEEPVAGKKRFLKGIFKKKASIPNLDEQDHVKLDSSRRDSHSQVAKSPPQPTPIIEAPNKPSLEEPPHKVTEKKPLQVPSIQRSVKTTITPSKVPEPTPEPKDTETKEDGKAQASKEDIPSEDKTQASTTPDEVLEKEDDDSTVVEKNEDAPLPEEKLDEVAVTEAPKEEEKKKVVVDIRKPLAGAMMLGGSNMLQEMKVRREKKAADRASREILENQIPKLDEVSPKETTEPVPATPGSPTKPMPKLNLVIPVVATPEPTSPKQAVPPSPTKPSPSPRLKSPIGSPQRVPLIKAVSNQLSPEDTLNAFKDEATPKEEKKERSEIAKPKPPESPKPKIENEKPEFKDRPLSGKFEIPTLKSTLTSPTTPEMIALSEGSMKPSDILKRNSAEIKARNASDIPKRNSVEEKHKEEQQSESLTKKPTENKLSRPPSRPSSTIEEKLPEHPEGKPNGDTPSPKPKPKPAKRPIIAAPGVPKKPFSLRKGSSPVVSISEAESMHLDSTLEGTPKKGFSLPKSQVSKIAPSIASKPRSRSLDPTMASKVAAKLPAVDIKSSTLLEVPESSSGKRDSILSKDSDEGAIEDTDECTAI